MATATAEIRAPVNTLAAFQNPNFRLYFAGQLISTAGTWMQNIAQAYLVFQITQRPLWSGIVACAAGLPLVFLSPIAGVVVDRVPRRTLMLFTQTTQMILAFILAFLAFNADAHLWSIMTPLPIGAGLHPEAFGGAVQVWHIVGLAFLLGVTNALDNPARQTIVLEIVGRQKLQSGIALNSIMVSSARVLGPAAAGIALVKVGVAWCFLINALSFIAVLASLLLMRLPYAIKNVSKASPLRQMLEGLQFARRDEKIAPLLLLVLCVGVFGLPIVQLFEPFASQALNSAKEGYAAISVGQGLGSVLAGVLVTWLTARMGRGRLIAVGLGLTSIAYMLFSLQTTVPLASIMAVFCGLFIVAEVISLNTQIQNLVPDEYRGRVMALYSLAFFGVSPFGALLFGGIGNIIGTPRALLMSALLGLIFGAAVLARWPDVIKES